MQLLASLAGKPATQTTTSNLATEKTKYRAVEVNGNRAGCCKAAQAIAGKRFLSDDVPKLPLSGCDANDCRCSYKYFDDRRTENRRESDVAFDITSQLCEQDNRSDTSSGRRSND